MSTPRIRPAPDSTPEDHPVPLGTLLTAEGVGKILGVPKAFVLELARRGDLPAVRVGERYVRFRLVAVHRWIAEHEMTAEDHRTSRKHGAGRWDDDQR